MLNQQDGATGKSLVGPRGVVLLVAACLFFTLVQATANFFAVRGYTMHDSFAEMVIGYLPVWLSIAVLTPAIDVMVRHFPWTSGRAGRVVPIHFAASLVFALLHLLLVNAYHFTRAPGSSSYGIVQSTRQLLEQYAVLDIAIYWGVAGTLLGLYHMRAQRAREVRDAEIATSLAHARLQMLRSQIRPHFLFNSLNTVAMQMRQGMNTEAIDMLAGLSDMLRASMSNHDIHETTLAAEIELTMRYVRIEMVRFGSRLEVLCDVDASAARALVPSMLLQPIVENAIRYGVSSRPGAALILIRARVAGDEAKIDILDDGDGVRVLSSKEAGHGVGLANTRERLTHLYGNRASLNLRNRTDGTTGAHCAITLPFHE